jgi:multiple sugar transport system substrate-binding protein
MGDRGASVRKGRSTAKCGVDDAGSPELGLSRRELLRRAGAGAVAIGLGGTGARTAYAFSGPHRFTKRQLAHHLEIAQWAHVVPGYDAWLDGTYARQWGERNDAEVTVDHVNSTELSARAAAEIDAGSGHDLFQLLSPPAVFESHTIPLDDAVEETTRRLGPISGVAHRSTYNPRTRHSFGFPDFYAPDPIVWRHDLWSGIGRSPGTWDDVLEAAPSLRSRGHPVGIGMSNGPESTLASLAVAFCFGAAIQDEAGEVRIDSKATRDYLGFVASLYRRGMTSEVFGWNPASNNQFLYSGTGSLILNPISATRAAEELELPFAHALRLGPVPRGPAERIAPAHTTGVYVIWKFSRQKELAKRYLIDQQVAYREHLARSRLYNLPAWPGAIEGGFAGIAAIAAADPHGPRGRYAGLAAIAERHTTNTGHPGCSNAAVCEIVDSSLIPRMAAHVAQGKLSAGEAARAAGRQFEAVFEKWRDQKLV